MCTDVNSPGVFYNLLKIVDVLFYPCSGYKCTSSVNGCPLSLSWGNEVRGQVNTPLPRLPRASIRVSAACKSPGLTGGLSLKSPMSSRSFYVSKSNRSPSSLSLYLPPDTYVTWRRCVSDCSQRAPLTENIICLQEVNTSEHTLLF